MSSLHQLLDVASITAWHVNTSSFHLPEQCYQYAAETRYMHDTGSFFAWYIRRSHHFHTLLLNSRKFDQQLLDAL